MRITQKFNILLRNLMYLTFFIFTTSYVGNNYQTKKINHMICLTKDTIPKRNYFYVAPSITFTSPGTTYVPNFGLSANYRYKDKHLITVGYVLNDNGTKMQEDIRLMYGRAFLFDETFYTAFSGGVARTNYAYDGYKKSVALALEAQTMVYGRFAGVGLTTYLSINQFHTYGGLAFTLHLGKLRAKSK